MSPLVSLPQFLKELLIVSTALAFIEQNSTSSSQVVHIPTRKVINDEFPELAPAAITRDKDGHIWDLDGNEYVDSLLGLGVVSLGHGYEAVLDAVQEQLQFGTAFQRSAAIELLRRMNYPQLRVLTLFE